MKYTEQDLKDEYEQAVKRKGELYAEGYVEGLKDAQNQALSIANVVRKNEMLCDCVMPDPIDPFAEVDKDTCRKCNNLIA